MLVPIDISHILRIWIDVHGVIIETFLNVRREVFEKSITFPTVELLNKGNPLRQLVNSNAIYFQLHITPNETHHTNPHSITKQIVRTLTNLMIMCYNCYNVNEWSKKKTTNFPSKCIHPLLPGSLSRRQYVFHIYYLDVV